MKVHFRDTRLMVNAGIQFPTCYANARLLDVDKSALETTVEREKVTCKHCQRIYSKRYSWRKP